MLKCDLFLKCDRIDNELPNIIGLKQLALLELLASDLIDIELPILITFSIDIPSIIRDIDRILIEDFKHATFTIEGWDALLMHLPNTLKVEPMRTNLRKLELLPRAKTSNRDARHETMLQVLKLTLLEKTVNCSTDNLLYIDFPYDRRDTPDPKNMDEHTDELRPDV
jgi:hypothetical protein